MVKKLFLCICLLLSLGACEQKKHATKTSQYQSTTIKESFSLTEKNRENKSNSSQEKTTLSSTSSDSPSTEQTSAQIVDSSQHSTQTTQKATTAKYNGSYYSVQGKYGEIIIANKKHPLSSSYAPGENPQALSAFQQLIDDMQAHGFAISNNYSGFRSYETQAGLYQSYVNQDGQVAADRYSARPGYSEHQTGLAFDLLDSAGNLLEEPTASQWLASNAHHYGFIVRYLPGKEYSTGYMAETWHVRYIGQEATEIYNSGLTLEEYFGVPGGGYE